MVKRMVSAFLQFVAFAALLYAGGNWDAINLGWEMRALQAGRAPHPLLMPTMKTQITSSHFLIENGIFYAAILLVVILLVQAVRRRLRPNAFYTLAAFVAALVITLALKIGLPPVS
jgi:hypothetical protein